MADLTSKMNIPYPSEYENPWFGTFESTMAALDGHDFSAFEDRNLFIFGGGVFAWNAITETLTWAAGIVIHTPSTGRLQTLAAGSVTLTDGDFFTVDVARGATDSVTLAEDVKQQIDPDDAPVALCIRYGTKLYFRNGVVMSSGDSWQVFEHPAAWISLHTDRRDQYVGNAITQDFVLVNTPHVNCLPDVYWNGVLQSEGAFPAGDYLYVVATQTVHFHVAPSAGPPADLITVRYWTA